VKTDFKSKNLNPTPFAIVYAVSPEKKIFFSASIMKSVMIFWVKS
jgi:hypothetical protein